MAETNSLLNCRTGNRTGGSNPPASAVKGVNQQVTWFTPFFAPKKSLVGIFDSANFDGFMLFNVYLESLAGGGANRDLLFGLS